MNDYEEMTAQRTRKERRIADSQKPYLQARKLPIKKLREQSKSGNHVAQRVLETTEQYITESIKGMLKEL